MGIHSWLRRRSGRTAAPGTTRRACRPALHRLEVRDVPAVVGYYDMVAGQGVPSQASPITAAGHTAVLLTDLTAADLAGIDILFVQNPDNAGYGAEYLSRLTSIQTAVANGLTLVLHDRYVDPAESILPGGAGFNIVRDFTDPASIDVIDDGTLVTHGPAGVVTDTTLDNGTNSSHGFALSGSLPADARLILGTGDHTHVVTFSYRFGAGNVVYSSIPLDFYLANKTTNPSFASIYAPNVVAYAADLLNVAPTAGAGALSTAEDATAAGRLTATDPNGDPLTYGIVSGPAHGTVALTDPATGDYVYTPAPNYFGTDSFTFRVGDGRGGAATGTVSITVTPVNDAPTAADATATAAEDAAVTVDVLANAADVDGDTLTAVLGTGPTHGTLTLNADGSFTYTPAADFNGSDSFTYTASDGTATSNVATVTITVGPVNDAPAAAADSYTVAEDSTLTVAAPGVLANDTDVDGDPLTAVLAAGPAHGTLTLNADGSVSYTPAANYSGPDSFTYHASDGSAASGLATVAITVTPVNDAPAAAADAYATAEDTPLTVPAPGVLANDSDVDGDALTAAVVTGPEHGTLTLNADGSFTYTPAANYSGPDAFTYAASDGQGGTATGAVSLTVTPVNDAPTAADRSVTADEDTPVIVTPAGTDVEGGPLTFALIAGPAHGTATANVDGTFTYAPAANYHGPDSFTYQANDGALDSAPATVSITVAPVNHAPVAAGDSYATSEDTPLTVAAPGVLTNDTDVDGDGLAAALAAGPAHGTLALNPDGSFTYTPAADFNGTDSFTYTLSDGRGGTATGTVTVTVAAVNDAPSFVVLPADVTANEGAPATFIAAATDLDDDPLAYAWNFGDGTTATGPAVTHTYAGDGAYTVVLTVSDGRGGSATATLTATVLNVPPVVTTGPGAAINEGGTFAAGGSFADPGADAWAATVDYGDGSGVQPLTLNADKTFALNHAYADDGVYTVTVRVADGGGVGTGTLTVRVNNVTPTANAGPDQTATEGDVVVLRGTFTDPGATDTHQFNWVVRDPSGRVVATGSGPSVTFVPADNGLYTAAFTVTDDDGGSSTATVRVTVANAPPTVAIVGPTLSMSGRPVSFTAAVTDPGSADTHTITWQVIKANGKVVATGTGSQLQFTPTPGTYTIECTVTDDDGAVVTTTQTLTVRPQP
jgi:large repetitive protein